MKHVVIKKKICPKLYFIGFCALKIQIKIGEKLFDFRHKQLQGHWCQIYETKLHTIE